MISKLGRIGVVGVLVIGGAVVAGSPAQAAAKAKCTTGKWTLKTTSLTVVGKDSEAGPFTTKVTGGAGARLTVKSGKAALDFNKSKKVVTTTVMSGEKATLASTYRKSLKVTAKFSGDKKGKFAFKPKSATGNATIHTVMTSPIVQDLGTASAVKTLRAGEPNFLLPSAAAFTCTKTTLTFALKSKVSDETSSGTLTTKVVYRRS